MNDMHPPAADERARLEAEIRQTRRELGETVEALSHRLDVKSRLRSKVEDGGRAVRSNPLPVGAAVAVALVTVVGIVVWRRRG
jgi:hypothetical protein